MGCPAGGPSQTAGSGVAPGIGDGEAEARGQLVKKPQWALEGILGLRRLLPESCARMAEGAQECLVSLMRRHRMCPGP